MAKLSKNPNAFDQFVRLVKAGEIEFKKISKDLSVTGKNALKGVLRESQEKRLKECTTNEFILRNEDPHEKGRLIFLSTKDHEDCSDGQISTIKVRVLFTNGTIKKSAQIWIKFIENNFSMEYMIDVCDYQYVFSSLGTSIFDMSRYAHLEGKLGCAGFVPRIKLPVDFSEDEKKKLFCLAEIDQLINELGL